MPSNAAPLKHNPTPNVAAFQAWSQAALAQHAVDCDPRPRAIGHCSGQFCQSCEAAQVHIILLFIHVQPEAQLPE
eukprot:CAMPEP_0115395342 /NCGR_PEP_ID=MMETSP0271-20121206/12737_1 /TAXON_ID=71861 /ORGANISM="Scrippsiella trochoidea, Strain CCMP3099" /LENGTH=74 /DNA_ID=CAMNT_0002819051 /DNA_START=475 /DNA_END=699 /DNA_ORIENTATION=+